MFDELKKSISAILYERTTSPLFGSIIVSWSVWNWRIIYLTLFISEEKIEGNKIDYIYTSLWDHNYLLWYPLLSTVILLTVIPFISNGAYWLSMRFENWKINQKNFIERNQLLTLEQSIAIRGEIYDQQKKFENLLSTKELEIKQIQGAIADRDDTINKLTKNLEMSKFKSKVFIENDVKGIDKDEDVMKMKQKILDGGMFQDFERCVYLIQDGSRLVGNGPSTKLISLLESNGYMDNLGDGKYRFTDKGKILQRILFDEIV